MPAQVYPLFENALRAKRGLSLERHRQGMGKLFSRFTEVAAGNPYAWFPTRRSADEITTVAPTNRMVAFPYTKYLNAVLETDQAAGVLMMSTEAARRLGVPESRWIYWHGGANSEEEVWFASDRSSLATSPALRGAVGGALAQAGTALGEIAHFDFYSCFPVAVEMACEMLGLEEDDPRGFTFTGGLPYAGGPGSNYTLHSLATLAQKLRADVGATGLVTGNGWYLTKHSASVWSTAPPRAGARFDPGLPDVAPNPPVEVAEHASGAGRVEAYTVLYERDGSPVRGIVLGRLDDGRRFIANTPNDRDFLEAFVSDEQVGCGGRLQQRDNLNRFDPH